MVSRRRCERRNAASAVLRVPLSWRHAASRGGNMSRMGQRALAAAALVGMLAVLPAAAQQTVRIRGPVEAVDGATLTVKAGEAGDVKVKLTDNAAVYGVVKASLADVKPGAFIGVGATPQADGSQRAIQVMIFSEPQRGTGEGHRPGDRPNTTMTKATVGNPGAGWEGEVVTGTDTAGEYEST